MIDAYISCSVSCLDVGIRNSRTFLAFGHQTCGPLHFCAPPPALPMAACNGLVNEIVAAKVVAVDINLMIP